MRVRFLVPAILATTLSACDSDPTATPDAAVGTYDKQPVGESRSANCGGTIGTVADGVLFLSADQSWTKVDVNATPSGSAVCAFIGGTWQRDNETTLTLIPGLPGFVAAQATIAGDDLTLTSTNSLYKRRR
jgi:hypothetical protein